MNNTLENLLDGFGVATVMDVHVLKLGSFPFQIERDRLNSVRNWYKMSENVIKEITKNAEKVMYLDTLQLSNIQESGPEKVFKAGAANVPAARVGKKVKVEIKDAIGKIDVLKNFFNLQQDDTGRLYCPLTFSTPLCLEGKTYTINIQTKKVEPIYIFMPFCVPVGELEFVASSEEFGAFDLSVELYPVLFEPEIGKSYKTFYNISKDSIMCPK